jgi:hypothetical protein
MAADSDGDYASGCSDYEGGGGGGVVDLIDSDAEEDQVSIYALCIHLLHYVCTTVYAMYAALCTQQHYTSSVDTGKP